jgi:hypothetical protein
MDARPTREFTTSAGRAIVYNEYITGEEHRQIRAIYIRAIKKTSTDDALADFEADNKAIELCVVSMDGKTDDILNRVLRLPLSEFREVVGEVQSIVEPKKNS